MEPRETTISNLEYQQDAMERAEEDHQQSGETITSNRQSDLDAMELVGEECQVQEATEMTTSNQDLNAMEPGTRSTMNVHMMNPMAVLGTAAEEANLVLVVAEVMVVNNERMIAIAADKAMVEANPAMAMAENLVTDEMKVTDAGVIVGMVMNPSSRLVLDEEGMAVVVVDMERVGMMRKDMGVDVDVVVERPDTRKMHMARKRIALALALHKVCLLSFPCLLSPP